MQKWDKMEMTKLIVLFLSHKTCVQTCYTTIHESMSTSSSLHHCDYDSVIPIPHLSWVQKPRQAFVFEYKLTYIIMLNQGKMICTSVSLLCL